MRVLIVHNRYQQPGGEDVVFDSEATLLAVRGCAVRRLEVSNSVLRTDSYLDQLGLALNTVWSRYGYHLVRAAVRQFRPDLVHFHNTFPLISPAAYYAAKAEGIPVIQTLHNYRVLCPNALFLRDGAPCEACRSRVVAWPAVVHRCYRQSRAATAAVAAMTGIHRILGTWRSVVDRYFALSDFARQRFVEGGLPADRIVVKPNFVDPDPGVGEHKGGYALFVGRLAREKGVETLLSAWTRLEGKVPLKVAGAGPLEATVIRRVEDGIEWLGPQTRPRVLSLMQEARLLVVPSLLYENFPMVIAEAYATGLPVLCSNVGSMADIVHPGRTGLLFTPGRAEELAGMVEWLWAHPEKLASMGQVARREFETRYSADSNYQQLMATYQQVAGEG